MYNIRSTYFCYFIYRNDLWDIWDVYQINMMIIMFIDFILIGFCCFLRKTSEDLRDIIRNIMWWNCCEFYKFGDDHLLYFNAVFWGQWFTKDTMDTIVLYLATNKRRAYKIVSMLQTDDRGGQLRSRLYKLLIRSVEQFKATQWLSMLQIVSDLQTQLVQKWFFIDGTFSSTQISFPDFIIHLHSD